jgi:hypothetical protein
VVGVDVGHLEVQLHVIGPVHGGVTSENRTLRA